MQNLAGAVVSRSWLKKLPLVLQLSNGSGNLFPSNIASYLQSLDSAAFRLLQCCLGKRWHKPIADKLQKLQNRAARALTFSRYDANASQLFQNLNCKNLSTQRDIQKALMVSKSLNGLAPEYLSSKFIVRSKTTSYTFRDSVNKLTIPQPRTDYLRNSLRYSGAVLWNSLPET